MVAIGVLPPKIERKNRRKAAGDATHFHGPTGLFGSGAIERDIISSVPRQISGLAAVLPIVPTVAKKTEFGTITGFTKAGVEAATPCDDGPKGSFQGCVLRNSFGIKIASTKTMDARDDISRTDRTDEDLTLIGMMMGGYDFNPDVSEDDMLNVVTISEMVGVGMQFEDHVIEVVWQGDPTNDNVGGGYKEAKGFDLQIATGITDINSVACPAMDSIVKNFDFSAPDENGGTDGDYNGKTLYDALKNIESTLHFRRIRAKARDLVTGIFMRPEMWEWVSEALPCQIESATCNNISDLNGTLYIDANRNLMKTDEMRELGQIRINGRTYRVYEDDGLRVLNNTTNPADLAVGEEASQIAWVPLTLKGFPVSYMRYKDYSKTARELVSPVLLRQWSDDGKYFWTVKEDNACRTVTGTLEISPILRTPQFAAKLLNVRHA